MKIGNVKLENNVILAPMAGITDLMFRILCKEQGCGLVYSEMVSAKGLMYESKNTHKLLESDKREGQVSVQIFGSDPKVMADMAIKLNDFDFDFLDINMGCPAPKIVKNGEGSALMLNPDLIGRIVSAVSKSSNKPVTIKIRKGFNNSNLNAVEIAKIAEENGAAAIAVHGRTREQYYSGCADWNVIKEVKKAVKIPVIGNGDITTPQLAEKMLNETGCDAIMIGRASQGNPWIFKNIIHYLKTNELLPPPSLEEKINYSIRHLEMLCEYKGDYLGVREMRKHLGWYTKGMPKSTELRVEVNKTDSKQAMIELLNEFLEHQQETP